LKVELVEGRGGSKRRGGSPGSRKTNENGFAISKSEGGERSYSCVGKEEEGVKRIKVLWDNHARATRTTGYTGAKLGEVTWCRTGGFVITESAIVWGLTTVG